MSERNLKHMASCRIIIIYKRYFCGFYKSKGFWSFFFTILALLSVNQNIQFINCTDNHNLCFKLDIKKMETISIHLKILKNCENQHFFP